MASRDYFPFMSLPPEMRNEIYSLVLGASHLIVTHQYQNGGLGKAVARRRRPRDADEARNTILNSALVLGNRQIYYETYSMLYTQPLHFYNAAALHTFLVAIGPGHRAMLTDITIHNWNFGHPLNGASLALLSETKNLRHLKVQCDNCTGPGIVAICAAQSACWDFGKWVDEVGLSDGREDSEFITERSQDDSSFCYSRRWVLSA